MQLDSLLRHLTDSVQYWRSDDCSYNASKRQWTLWRKHVNTRDGTLFGREHVAWDDVRLRVPEEHAVKWIASTAYPL